MQVDYDIIYVVIIAKIIIASFIVFAPLGFKTMNGDVKLYDFL